MNIKNPKIILGIPIIILTAIIITVVLDDTNTDTSTHSINSEFKEISKSDEYEMLSNNLYSGPFAILDGTYGVDDPVFFIGSEIPLNSKGEIVFVRPDGKIHHTHPFDGAKSAVNHYFTPVSSKDLKECPKCKFFGIWDISFRVEKGISYAPMHFEVINEN
ncbi:MAG: hypothetical protein K5777_03490 [Nitrosopumilus sp.]|nr:hypothetical protein [Nitrosopumilus sp.]